MTDNENTDQRNSRTRRVLAVVLVLMLLLLGGLVWFVANVLKPAGAPNKADLPPGLTWVRSIYGYGTRADQQLAGDQHVAIGPDGTIWVSDGPHSRVLGFNPDGTLHGQLASPSLNAPGGLTVSDNNEIYVADFQNLAIDVFTASGRLVRAWHTGVNPYQVAVRGDRVVVTCVDGVHIFTRQGQLVAKWGSRGRAPEQIDGAQGVAIGADGTIYIADTQNAKIKAFTSSGKLLWVGPQSGLLGGGVKGSGSQSSSDLPLQLPAGMTWDGRGHLVLVDPFSFQIMVADPNNKAKIIARYGDSGQTDGLFMYPTGISYDPARNWFAVADTANKRVQIVRIPDSASSDLLPALRRIAGVPLWICGVPLLLLLLALIAAMAGRRGRSSRTQAAAEDL
jgi:sugar lactone lactonase YvrE